MLGVGHVKTTNTVLLLTILLTLMDYAVVERHVETLHVP